MTALKIVAQLTTGRLDESMGVPSRAFSRTSPHATARKTGVAPHLERDVEVAWEIVASRTHVPAVDSTNSAIARRFASDPHLPSWTLLTADHQTRGRGRYGRTWVDASNALLASLFVRVPDEKLDWITALTGLAIVRALDDLCGDTCGNIGLKWPNDVIVEGRKVAGILAEHLGTSTNREASHALVIGIGLNLAPTDSAAGPNAGYVPVTATHDQVLVAIIAHLHALLGQGSEAWRDAYSSRLIGKGQPTSITHADGTRTDAVIVDVDDRAGLIVSTGESLQTITCGDVALPAYSPKEAR